LIRALKARFPGTRTRIYYGSTEAGAATSLGDADVLRKPGSVGPPSPGVDLKLTEAGEICVRSAYLMDGYFDDPEATAAALRDGWFHTGDMARQDEDGYFYIAGRFKDMIISGGENVYAAEVEAVFVAHEAVTDAALIGQPDEKWGEVGVMVVVLANGRSVTETDLLNHCRGKLARYKIPKRIIFTDALPYSPYGKVIKAQLKELLNQWDTDLHR
jgi:acyl-CoA synthetase (AMP-forming)/AMP-acid ligase II